MDNAKRVIIALDSVSCGEKPHSLDTSHGSWVYVKMLAAELQHVGITLKVETSIRAIGYRYLPELIAYGDIFADLKLSGTPHTLMRDARLLAKAAPAMVSVMVCPEHGMGRASLESFKRELRQLGAPTRVFGVTGLSSTRANGRCILRNASMAREAGLDGIILPPSMLSEVRHDTMFDELRCIVPGIRPMWSHVEDDDQKGPVTPKAAIMAGADYIVVGRPVTEATRACVRKVPRLPETFLERVEYVVSEVSDATRAREEALVRREQRA